MTGQLPFRGESSGVIFKAILTRQSPLLCGRTQIFPRNLEEIVTAFEKGSICVTTTHPTSASTLQRLKRDTESARVSAAVTASPTVGVQSHWRKWASAVVAKLSKAITLKTPRREEQTRPRPSDPECVDI